MAGIVLGGGGARGAYEAGVLAGLLDVLGPQSDSLFEVFCGTSVGAINAAWMAAHADDRRHCIGGLLDYWCSLSIDKHLRPNLRAWLPWTRQREVVLGRAVIDPRALEQLVEDGIPWSRLRRNVREGRVRGLVVTALRVGTGRTTIFTELRPGQHYPPTRDPRREHVAEPITADHVLASAAVPLLFPARRISGGYYCDGGLRSNTPIAPALRLGVRKLVVIPLLQDEPVQMSRDEAYPSLVFLAGKLMNALLLDPIDYDLQVLRRFNSLIDVLERSLSEMELQRVHQAMTEARGAPYRRVETLVFRPSLDLGVLARERGEHLAQKRLSMRFLRRLTDLPGAVDADLLSFILFDGDHARTLIDLGRADVRARADEVRAFFTGAAPAD